MKNLVPKLGQLTDKGKNQNPKYILKVVSQDLEYIGKKLNSTFSYLSACVTFIRYFGSLTHVYNIMLKDSK